MRERGKKKKKTERKIGYFRLFMNITKQQWYLKKKGKTKLLWEQESSDFNFESEVKVRLYLEQRSLQISHLCPRARKHYWGGRGTEKWAVADQSLSARSQNCLIFLTEQDPA